MIKNQTGFSLMEFVIVIVILGLLAGMSAILVSQGFNAYFNSSNLLDANAQGELAMQRMTRDIQMLRSSNDVSVATANQFAFTDINNNTISYGISGTTLTITRNGSTQTLADGVNSLVFTYYGSNGATPAISNSGYVVIALNITQNNVNYTLTTAAYPRNLTA